MKIIPKVKEYIGQEGSLTLADSLAVSYGDFSGETIEAFCQRTKTKIAENAEQRLSLERVEGLAEGAYVLSVKEDEITVKASDEDGIIYGLTTLYQMMDGKRQVPYGQVTDAPAYAYRGLHVDVARHFFDAAAMKKVIEEMSLVKINYLHWHLADDQGWRIAIDKYPELTRQCGDAFYSKDQIKEVVDFAKKRGITVIPEIDMPGHTRAMTAAYPFLSCSGQPVKLATCGGIYPIILCPGKDATFTFVKDVLDEIVPLFPGSYIHIGGDEAPKGEWKKCPDCQKRIEEKGLADEVALQGYFTRQIAKYLEENYQKKVICWNDSLEAVDFLEGQEIVQYWSLEHKKQLPDFIEKGGHFIYSDMFDLYYDYPAAMSPMKRSYTCRPLIDGKDYAGHPAMIGYEACTWSEYIETPQALEERVFPRLYAMAEHAWAGEKDTTEAAYGDYEERLDYFKKHFAKVSWGSGDPKGLKKTAEKMGYAKKMMTGMSPEVKASTVEAAAVSEEFTKTFTEKMMKS